MEEMTKALSGFEVETIYNGETGGAFNGKRYLANAITSEGKTTFYSTIKLNEGIDFEPGENERGGVIVFSTDVNAIKQHDNRFIDFLKQKMMTLLNKFNATKVGIATDNNLIGWTVGHYLGGCYTAKNGKQFGENSLSVEVIGIPFETLLIIAEELCRSFTQESVLLKDHSSGRVLFVNQL